MVIKHEEPEILEAIETLTSIADLDLEQEGGVVDEGKLIVQENRVLYRTFNWQKREDIHEAAQLVQHTFQTILKYLRNFCKKEHGFVTDKQSIEGIKSIMVLVGETARKLDKYTTLFHDSEAKRVSGLDEYKKLQEFYLTRIAHKVDTRMLGQWILGISQQTLPKERSLMEPEQAKRVIVDLDSVKRDTEYELFFMRKEDGSRFYNPRLIRNMKLVCDFGEVIQDEEGKIDPLTDLDIWYDQSLHISARNILRSLGSHIDWFYQEATKFKNRDLVASLSKAMMALMLSGNAKNLLEKDPAKCCAEYFYDFQQFLGEALKSRDYQKFIAYPPKKSSKFSHHLLDTTNAICQAFFLTMEGYHENLPIIQKLIHEGMQRLPEEERVEKQLVMSRRLADNYAAIAEMVKRHPNGPLTRVLEILEEGACHHFDPLHQENIPNQLFSFFMKDHKVKVLHAPTPTTQEFIHKVSINDEFKGFLHANPSGRKKKKYLLFNLQDRTSWKEHARCVALEELPEHHDFGDFLDVVTLAKDTDFYQQVAPYDKDHKVEVFFKHFLEQLTHEDAGYYFAEGVKEKLLPKLAEEMIHAVHRIFFSLKNVLSVEERRNFIEIFYLFMQLKLIELTKPEYISFTCKDGIDIGGASSVMMLAFMLLLTHEKITDADVDQLDISLFAPALLVRGRVMLPERFDRMLSALKVIEGVRHEYGYDNFVKIIHEAFGRFYKVPMLDAVVS